MGATCPSTYSGTTSNGHFTVTGQVTPSLDLVCNSGYGVVGGPSKCSGTVWNANGLQCVSQSAGCSAVPAASYANGALSTTATAAQTQVSITCNTGYYLPTSVKATCSLGSWSGLPSTSPCVPVVCTPGATRALSCGAGLVPSVAQQTCTNNAWAPASFTCGFASTCPNGYAVSSSSSPGQVYQCSSPGNGLLESSSSSSSSVRLSELREHVLAAQLTETEKSSASDKKAKLGAALTASQIKCIHDKIAQHSPTHQSTLDALVDDAKDIEALKKTIRAHKDLNYLASCEK